MQGGKQSGRLGKYTFENGSKWKGELMNGLPTGLGTQVNDFGGGMVVKKIGVMNDGKWHGRVTVTEADGTKITYLYENGDLRSKKTIISNDSGDNLKL